MKRLVIGILAHVDAGKTTLSEAMLYTSGALRKPGRVDNRDAFLDTYELERERGITIFSKQARMIYKDLQITLLDTPGHVDFSAEMERTLQVLDYAILVIGAMDGIQGHTRTLWRLLKSYQIPVFLFVNKMDQGNADRQKLMEHIREELSEDCIDFSASMEEVYDGLAMCSEEAMEEFLQKDSLADETIAALVKGRCAFPCFFGSALKFFGVEEFIEGIDHYTQARVYSKEFGARVFKIGRDEQGNRLTYLKLTGGSLRVKSLLDGQKVNQLRLYSGAKYELAQEVDAGEICAVTGPTGTFPGQSFGVEHKMQNPFLEPILMYQILLPPGCDAMVLLPKLRELEEEEPLLHIVWEEEQKEIRVQLMGEVQTEVLGRLIEERFQVKVAFGEGSIIYKETIADTVEGVGHFEPLRHYAEVHLLMEPAERGSGILVCSDCSTDVLAESWQRLVLTHLKEKEHRGVLTGSFLTDVKITLVSGRAHQKHTEGGDFREATYRAVRQGLMQAQSVLLEPYFDFVIEVPAENIGRLMNDMEQRKGSFQSPELMENGMAVLVGQAPAGLIQAYQKELSAYTRGRGRLSLSLSGYAPCHNEEEIIQQAGYFPERDIDNPADSVFCSHGAGTVVSWDRVKEHMHLPSFFDRASGESERVLAVPDASYREEFIEEEEIERIFARTFFANKADKTIARKKFAPAKKENISGYTGIRNEKGKKEPREEYLLVDGYNVIFAWEELRELASVSIDGARIRLLDIMCNYQGMKQCQLIVVFDAYRVQGHATEVMDYHNIHVVYTKEAETADQYIEKFAHDNSKRYQVTVATSDGLEQIIIRGQGCLLLSARELYEEVEKLGKELEERYLSRRGAGEERELTNLGEKLRGLEEL